MNALDTQTLLDATISALERTAMMLVEPVGEGDTLAIPTRFARISYRGPSQGNLTLGATDGFLRELAASLLGVEPADVNVDKEGTDALKELANILGGSAVLALSGEACDYSLGLPEVLNASETPAVASSGTRLECAVTAEGGSLRVVWMQERAVAVA